MKSIRVSAAVIVNDNKILVSRRCYGKYSGYWEFPGGKREEGEGGEEAIRREIREELNLEIAPTQYLGLISHDYEDFHLDMDLYQAEILSGTPKATVHDKLMFIKKEELSSLELLPADLKAIPLIESKLI